MSKKTYAQIAEELAKKEAKYQALLDNATNDAERNSAELMLKRVGESRDMLMSDNQSRINPDAMKKNYADGGPVDPPASYFWEQAKYRTAPYVNMSVPSLVGMDSERVVDTTGLAGGNMADPYMLRPQRSWERNYLGEKKLPATQREKIPATGNGPFVPTPSERLKWMTPIDNPTEHPRNQEELFRYMYPLRENSQGEPVYGVGRDYDKKKLAKIKAKASKDPRSMGTVKDNIPSFALGGIPPGTFMGMANALNNIPLQLQTNGPTDGLGMTANTLPNGVSTLQFTGAGRVKQESIPANINPYQALGVGNAQGMPELTSFTPTLGQKIGHSLKNISGSKAMDAVGMAAPFIDNLAFGKYVNSVKGDAAPEMHRVNPLQTTWDINPQVNAAKESQANLNRSLDRTNTSRGVANNAKIAGHASTMDQIGQLYGQKTNRETMMENQNTARMDQTANHNRDLRTRHRQNMVDFNNQKAAMKYANKVNISEDIGNIHSQRMQQRAQQQQLQALYPFLNRFGMMDKYNGYYGTGPNGYMGMSPEQIAMLNQTDN